jgi:glyoxylate/hydroxypyruvate reductase A
LANGKSLNVLIASYLEPELVDRIRKEVPEVKVHYHPELLGSPRYTADHTAPVSRSPEQEAQWQALLAEADILFDFDASHREDLPDLAPNVKWIQATSAGIGQFVRRIGYADRTDWVFTTASGVHARPLAEFAVMSMLMFVKNFTYLQAEKGAHHWQRYCAAELSGLTVGIIGLGKIGREVARLAKAFETTVIGSRRHPAKGKLPFVDTVYGPDGLPQILRQAQFLVLTTPHTDETDRLIGRAELEMLPEGAVLINIARGSVVDQGALTEALRSGHLSGAALDVFEVEPLPPDDPLWSMPNVIISPHSASTADSENRKLTRLFCDNLRRFLTGESLLNVLDTERLY